MIDSSEIKKWINSDLSKLELKEKYLTILTERLINNKKTMSRLFFILVITSLIFPLILSSKVTEFSLGPVKILDNHIALLAIPTVFSYTYYKYLLVWLDYSDQKKMYTQLTAQIFEIKHDSHFNKLLRTFSFIDSLDIFITSQKLGVIGCASFLVLFPIGLIVLIFPIAFEIYSITTIYQTLNKKLLLDWVFLILPIIISFITVLIFIQQLIIASKNRN